MTMIIFLYFADSLPFSKSTKQNAVVIPDDEAPPVSSHHQQQNHPSSLNGQSLESLRSSFTNRSSDSSPHTIYSNDGDLTADEKEERARLISQVLELQNTLDDLSQRVDSVKEENLRLHSENQVLGQYIENLMSASSVFQSTSPGGTTIQHSGGHHHKK